MPFVVAALFEQHRRNPKILRIATWDRLERDGAGVRLQAVIAATEEKLNAIRSAQRDGVITKAYPPEMVLQIVIGLSQPPLGPPSDDADPRFIANAVRAALRV